MLDLLSGSWKILVLRGLLGIVFGIMLLAWPGISILSFALLWGIWAMIDGVGLIADVFAPGASAGLRIGAALMGIVALFAGLIAITRPGLTAVTLTWILGIWLIARGIYTAIAALISAVAIPKALAFASAVLDVLVGILIVSHPGRAAVTIAWLIGLIAVAWGVAFLVMGIATRKTAREFAQG